MKSLGLLFVLLSLFSTSAFARMYVYKLAGADVLADNTWRVVMQQNFTVTANTEGMVIVTIPFMNQSCTGNSVNCSPSKMATGQVKVSLRDNSNYLHDQETVWIDNSVVLNPNGGVTSLLVKNAGPYTLHLSAPDMRPGTYTLTIEMMAIGGTSFRPLKHNGVKATVKLD